MTGLFRCPGRATAARRSCGEDYSITKIKLLVHESFTAETYELRNIQGIV